MLEAPLAPAIRKVGQHSPLDLWEYIAHQAIGTGAFTVAAVADHAEPKVRRLGPSRRRLRPTGMADQGRSSGEQSSGDIIRRTGCSFSGGGDPIAPGRPEQEEM